MDTVTYLQINLIPMLALLIMRANVKYTLTYSWRSRALRFMMVLLVGVFFTNITGRYFDGGQMPGTRVFLWLSNELCLGLLAFMAYIWYLYTRDVAENGIGQRGTGALKLGIPFFIFAALLLTTPWTGIIFSLDEQNFYVRGDGYMVYVIVTMGYVVASSVHALCCAKKEEQVERRLECKTAAGFAILPVCGGLLQMLYPAVEFAGPFTAASVLMVYLDVQQRQVIRDALTGLNNRGRLDQYLLEMEEQNWRGDSYHLLLMDVDQFKKINDRFGHMTGDHVLRLVADQLKKTFGRTSSFLARYGGDEFVVILKGKNDDEVAAYIDTLRRGIAGMNWGERGTWNIVVSIGCVKAEEAADQSIRQMLELADARMYEDKKKNRKK